MRKQVIWKKKLFYVASNVVSVFCKYLSSELSEIFRGLISNVKPLVILYELVEIWKRFDQPSLWIFPVNFGFTVTKHKCNLFQIIWLTDSVNSRLQREVRLQERI